MNIETFYQGFCKETFDENGVLNTFEPVLAENFNFAYDVVDEIARQEPDRRAMVWCNETGESPVKRGPLQDRKSTRLNSSHE